MDFRLSKEQQRLQQKCRELAADFATRSAKHDRDASNESDGYSARGANPIIFECVLQKIGNPNEYRCNANAVQPVRSNTGLEIRMLSCTCRRREYRRRCRLLRCRFNDSLDRLPRNGSRWSSLWRGHVQKTLHPVNAGSQLSDLPQQRFEILLRELHSCSRTCRA